MVAPPAIRKQVDAQHAQIRKQDDALLSNLTRAYRDVYDDLRPRLEAITNKIEAAIKAGKEPSASWLFEQGRLKQLEAQVIKELGEYGRTVEGIITDAQRGAVELAEAHTGKIVRESFSHLPKRAVEGMVGRTHATDTPLSKVLDRYPAKAAQSIRRTLISSVALGRSPKETSRLLRKDLGGNLNSYMTLARTEHMSAYRAGSLATYRENKGVITGWVWRTGYGERTCPVCSSKDGKVYPLTEEFSTHPRCRCCPAPQVAAVGQGAMQEPARFESGEEDKAHEWGKAQFEGWREQLTEREKYELHDYKAAYYKDINGQLRNDEKLIGDWKAMVRDMDTAIAKGKITEDVIVHRGMDTSFIKGDLSNMVGTVYRDKGYVSTSLTDARAKFFIQDEAPGERPALVEIRVPKGSTGAYMPNIEAEDSEFYDFHKREYELLLPRGSKFNVVDVQQTKGKPARIVMELIND